MKRRTIFLFLILCLIGAGIFWLGIYLEPKEKEAKPFPSDRAEKFYISSGEVYPVFSKEVIVDPFKVKEGEEQRFSVWAKDPKGIEKVIVKISTDKEERQIELKLVEGATEEGRWFGSWTTKEISTPGFYPAIFQAKNKEGRETSMTLAFQVVEK